MSFTTKINRTTLPFLSPFPAANTPPIPDPRPRFPRYGGYALSFTVALGLGANVASTYLLVASSYLLLLAGAVGFWATRSGRPDAFRIHSAALVPAGAVYASLSVVQVVAVGPSDGLVADGWEDLRADGENLYSIQVSDGVDVDGGF